MKKSELKNGMMVETREGNLYLVVGDFMTREDGFINLSIYKDDMTSFGKYDYFLDIMKVYEFENDVYKNNATSIRTLFNRERLTLLWERKEHNLTEREVETLRALQTLGCEWFARDLDGSLYAFDDKPEKMQKVWLVVNIMATPIDKDLFTFIKWADEEPVSIK